MRAQAAATALLLVGCDRAVRVEGTVEILGSSDHAGIAVESDDGRCSAVTDARGSFAMDCRSGMIRVALQQASIAHYPSEHAVDLSERTPKSLGPWTLTPQPPSDGLWLVSPTGTVPLTRTHLIRTSDRGAKSYCLATEPVVPDEVASAGSVYLIDQQAPRWKVFRLDEQGCAQHWKWHAGDWRVTASDEPEGVVRQIENASVHHFTLPAGQYFIADWADGRLTPDRVQSTTTGEKRYLGAILAVAD